MALPRSIVATLVVLASAGCVPLYGRPALSVQLATREVEIVAARRNATAVWSPVVEGSSDGQSRGTGEPDGLAAVVQRADANAALAAAVVAEGNRSGHTHFVLSPDADARPATRGAGRAAYVVRVTQLSFVGSDAGDRPLLLWAWMSAAEVTEEEVYPSFATALEIVDPVPRTRDEWTADGGRAVSEAIRGLIARGAPRLVAELTAMTGRLAPKGGYCGLEPTVPLADGVFTYGSRVLRWEPYEPRDEGVPLRIAYDVRVWRLGEAGYDPVVVEDGLAEPAARLEAEPGYEYAMTARATVEAPGGRRWSTPWSVPTAPPARCAARVEPHRLLRRFAGPAAPVAVQRSLPATPPETPPGAGRVRVVTHAGPASAVASQERIRIGFTRGTTEPAKAAAVGVASGALRGLGESLRCAIFMPVCAVILVPAVATLGGVAGAAEEASLTTGQGPQNDLLRALAGAVTDPSVARAVLTGAGSATPVAPTEGDPGAETTVLELGLVRASLAGGKTERPATTLEIEVAATLKRPGVPPERRAVVAIGPGPVPMELWLLDGETALLGAIRSQAARAARELVRAFAAPPPPP